MITKEKIEQAAEDYVINDLCLSQGAAYNNAIKDFKSGVLFAESEMKPIDKRQLLINFMIVREGHLVNSEDIKLIDSFLNVGKDNQ